MCSPYSQSTCSQLCKNHGQIWNESPNGRRLVGATDYGGSVTSLSLCNSYTIQYLTSGPPGYYHLFAHHCFYFHSGPAENQVGKPHLQFGGAPSHWCDSTAGVDSDGFSSSKIIGCASNGHSAPNSIFTFYFCASSSINNFIYAHLTSFSSNHWYNRYGGAC